MINYHVEDPILQIVILCLGRYASDFIFIDYILKNGLWRCRQPRLIYKNGTTFSSRRSLGCGTGDFCDSLFKILVHIWCSRSRLYLFTYVLTSRNPTITAVDTITTKK